MTILADLPVHVSYSSYSQFLQCGWKYYLERTLKLPTVPAWWNIGGHAVHAATEVYDHGSKATADDLFAVGFEEEYDKVRNVSDVPEEEWLAGGRVSTKYPNKQDKQWWLEQGPVMVQAWIDWRARSGWQLWEACSGQLAIEMAMNIDLGGLPVKMYVDRVMITPDGQLVVVDIKTGVFEPESDLQLGFYACGLERVFGMRPQLGGYWMARKGDIGQVHNLDHLTPELLGTWVSTWDRARKAGIFMPHPTRLCRACGVREYCAAVGGAKSGSVDV